MINPRCIRIFNSAVAAERAKQILQQAQIESYIKEDTFGSLTLEDLGMRPRFRLYIAMRDINKVAVFLGKKLKEKHLD